MSQKCLKNDKIKFTIHLWAGLRYTHQIYNFFRLILSKGYRNMFQVYLKTIFGSGALSGKVLPVRIIEINISYAYFRSG